jgi:hypothetical protein
MSYPYVSACWMEDKAGALARRLYQAGAGLLKGVIDA